MNQNTEKKIRMVQQITIEHKRNGLSQKEIYWRYIREQYYISQGTYNRYLAIKIR